MPRQKRVDEARMIHHALNRGNARTAIFHKPDDYDAFLRVLAEGLGKYQVDLFYHTRGYGHIYQSRFKSFPVQDDTHFYVLCRYIERNPLRANLVTKAELWPHGSLDRWNQPTEPTPKVLSPWPLPRLPNWNDRVNAPVSEKELEALRNCVNRGRPYGDEQ